MLGAAVVVAVVQVISQDLALSALCGLVVVIAFRAIPWHEIDAQIEGGIRLMGQIAIIMLVAGGYASVIKATGEHHYDKGVCTVCGAKDPNYKPPTTGDSGILLYVGLAVMAIGGSAAVVTRKKERT